MAAITSATARNVRNIAGLSYAKYRMTANTTIPQGGLVMVTQSTQRALNAADTAACNFVGIATETVSAGAADVVYINVEYGHEVLLTSTEDLSGLVGVGCGVKTNDEVQTIGTATNKVQVGTIIEVPSATKVWVGIRVLSPDLA